MPFGCRKKNLRPSTSINETPDQNINFPSFLNDASTNLLHTQHMLRRHSAFFSERPSTQHLIPASHFLRAAWLATRDAQRAGPNLSRILRSSMPRRKIAPADRFCCSQRAKKWQNLTSPSKHCAAVAREEAAALYVNTSPHAYQTEGNRVNQERVFIFGRLPESEYFIWSPASKCVPKNSDQTDFPVEVVLFPSTHCAQLPRRT